MRLRVAGLVLVASVAAARTVPAPCALGSFLTADGHHVLTNVVAPATESVIVGAASAAIEPGCPATAATLRTTRRGTLVRARWTSCPGLHGTVKLRALIAGRTCQKLRGTVTVGGTHRALRATRAPFAYDVPVDPKSPWPKFRRTTRQDGASPVHPSLTG